MKRKPLIAFAAGAALLLASGCTEYETDTIDEGQVGPGPATYTNLQEDAESEGMNQDREQDIDLGNDQEAEQGQSELDQESGAAAVDSESGMAFSQDQELTQFDSERSATSTTSTEQDSAIGANQDQDAPLIAQQEEGAQREQEQEQEQEGQEGQQGQQAQQAQPGQEGQQELSDKQLVGSQLHSSEGEVIGTIKEVSHDPQSGQTSYLGIEPKDDQMTSRNQLVAIPVTMVKASDKEGQKDTVELKVDKEQLANAPRINSQQWPKELPRAWGAQNWEGSRDLSSQPSSPDNDTEANMTAETGIEQSTSFEETEFAREDRTDQVTSRLSSEQEMEQGQTTAATGQEEQQIVLNEEQLNVDKRQVEAGSVEVRKTVKTEEVQEPVQLKREKLVIERQPVDGNEQGIAQAQSSGDQNQPDQSDGQAFQEEEIRITLNREEPVVQKESRPREIVTVKKETETEQANVSATLRSEDIQVNKQGELGSEAIEGETATQSQAAIRDTQSRDLRASRDRTGARQSTTAESGRASLTAEADQTETRNQFEEERGEVNYAARDTGSSEMTQRERQGQQGQQRGQEDVRGAGSERTTDFANRQANQRIYFALTRGAERERALVTPQQFAEMQFTSDQGIVTVKGQVESEQKKRQIAERIRQMEGVKSVKNELTVKGQEQQGQSQDRQDQSQTDQDRSSNYR